MKTQRRRTKDDLVLEELERMREEQVRIREVLNRLLDEMQMERELDTMLRLDYT